MPPVASSARISVASTTLKKVSVLARTTSPSVRWREVSRLDLPSAARAAASAAVRPGIGGSPSRATAASLTAPSGPGAPVPPVARSSVVGSPAMPASYARRAAARCVA